MCGILGAFPAIKFDKNFFESQLLKLKHRGPDNQQAVRVDDVFLGHTRLSIIDLNYRSDQPMADTGKRIWIVFNGEIYNFKSLREELSTKFKFHTESDTEVILAAYQEWGLDCFQKFLGMFALAIFDRDKNKIILARDPVGKKPLYYYRERGMLIFGSEVKALIGFIPNGGICDETGFANYLARGCTGRLESIYAGIKKVFPGTYMEVELGSSKKSLNTSKYWSLNVASESSRDKSEPELISELDSLLIRSVGIRTQADVPLGCFLSGGLDSSMIAALASYNSEKPIDTFTAIFPGTSVDESKYAKKVSSYLGTNHTEIILDMDFIDEIPGIIKTLDEPFADSSIIPSYFVCKKAREHVTVCLSGDGGDELFAGYGHYDDFSREMTIRRNLPARLTKYFGLLALHLPERHKTRSFKRLRIDDPIASFSSYYSNFFNEEERNKLLKHGPLKSSSVPEDEIMSFYKDGYSWIENVCQADFQSYMVEDILVKVDRMSMLNSLEIRSPFLDKNLVEFCFKKVPPELKKRGHVKKYLLKKAAQRYLPGDFEFERKQGFSVPLGLWFKGALGDLLMDTVSAQNSDFFDINYVYSLLQIHRCGFSNYSKKLFNILVWEIWAQTNNISYNEG